MITQRKTSRETSVRARSAPGGFCRAVALGLLLAVPFGAARAAAGAPATQPAAVNAIESMPLRRGAAPGDAQKASNPSSGAGWGASRVFGALAIVIGAILVFRWGSKKFLGLQLPSAAGSAVHVLSRQVVGPRQQLMLIQVGRRIVLVANCGAQMNSLCELSDAEEVAALLSQVNQRKSVPVARPFWSFFRGERSQFGENEIAAAPPRPEKVEPELATTREEIHGLLSKVQAISRSFKKA